MWELAKPRVSGGLWTLTDFGGRRPRFLDMDEVAGSSPAPPITRFKDLCRRSRHAGHSEQGQLSRLRFPRVQASVRGAPCTGLATHRVPIIGSDLIREARCSPRRSPSRFQQSGAPVRRAQYVRLYADEAGESRFEDLETALVPVDLGQTPHPSPQRQVSARCWVSSRLRQVTASHAGFLPGVSFFWRTLGARGTRPHHK